MRLNSSRVKTSLALLTLSLGFLSAVQAEPVPANSTITAVTVYGDRAVVTRTAPLTVNAGALELVFERLPAALLDQSLQVSGHGTAGATILDVTARATYVDYTPNERVKSLEDELRALARQRRALEDRAKTLKAQEASLNRIENSSTQPPAKETPRLSIDEAAKLLVFLDEQRGKLATEQESLDAQAEELAAKSSALDRQLAELRGAGGRAFKTVRVRLAAASAGSLDLALSYAVPQASWSPSYDARVLSAEHAVQLGYFGVVHQNTGEDWKDVDLTLSTARPSLGGSPPPLAEWLVDIMEPQRMRKEKDEEVDKLQAFEFKRKSFAAPASETGGMIADALSERRDQAAAFAQSTIDAQATSASFKIPVAATIPSDNSPQKVPVTAVRLDTAPEYLATPKLLKAAFLTAKVTNSSEFPLIAGGMNVFLDSTFVASSALRTVMPGEKFDLALGADEAIAVKRKLNNRFSEDTGLVTKGKRVTYDYTLTVQNNKKTAEKISLLDQVPVSRNEKVVVRVLAPEDKDPKPEADGTLKWTFTLKPGEKREFPLKFSVDFPAEVLVAGVD